MRIYTPTTNLEFSVFTFPDGQPHFKLEDHARESQSVVIETAIKAPSDLFVVLMASDVLRQYGYSEISLDIRYLMGARMDRAIDTTQPFSLQLVARLLNGGGFTKIRILDVHSDVATKLILNSENVLPIEAAKAAIVSSGANVLVVPDKGAVSRVRKLWSETKYSTSIIYCKKTRDPETGALSGFKVGNYEPENDGYVALIADDVCDGGGTFVGLAKELRKAGAWKVMLFVTHGIFSKGVHLEGIDRIFCTDSYDGPEVRFGSICGVLYPDGKTPELYSSFTVIPISMKEI